MQEGLGSTRSSAIARSGPPNWPRWKLAPADSQSVTLLRVNFVKKRLAYFGISILIFAAIFVTFRSERGVRFVWKVVHGNQMTWSGIVIRLGSDEYFFPKSSGQNFLHIGDSGGDALISVKKETRTVKEQFVYIEQNCKIVQCSHIETRRLEVEGVPVTLTKYLEHISDNEIFLQHAYLIEGADVWVEYTGDKTRFPVHKSTIDEIVAGIARKVKLGSSAG